MFSLTFEQCSKVGHIARNCPEAGGYGGGYGGNRGGYGGGFGGRQTNQNCFSCGGAGHLSVSVLPILVSICVVILR
jgi:hypothetical protein